MTEFHHSTQTTFHDDKNQWSHQNDSPLFSLSLLDARTASVLILEPINKLSKHTNSKLNEFISSPKWVAGAYMALPNAGDYVHELMPAVDD